MGETLSKEITYAACTEVCSTKHNGPEQAFFTKEGKGVEVPHDPHGMTFLAPQGPQSGSSGRAGYRLSSSGRLHRTSTLRSPRSDDAQILGPAMQEIIIPRLSLEPALHDRGTETSSRFVNAV